MRAFGQEPEKEKYCGKCVSEGQHKLVYVVPELDDNGQIVEGGTPTIIKKEIKPKIIGGRCERCMKGNLIDLKI